VALYFCSLECWNAHLPDARHREAWAEPVTAPSREAWEREQREAVEAEARAQKRGEKQAPAPLAPASKAPREVLIVVSKAKDHVKGRAGMSTSDGVFDRLSDAVRRLCDEAIASAAHDGRKTVLDRDLRRPTSSPRVIRRGPTS
jgi:histone H3/H4